jgi:hypothetical protein
MEKWEYLNVDVAEKALNDVNINTYGEYGWELVSIIHRSRNIYRFYFKRKK